MLCSALLPWSLLSYLLFAQSSCCVQTGLVSGDFSLRGRRAADIDQSDCDGSRRGDGDGAALVDGRRTTRASFDLSAVSLLVQGERVLFETFLLSPTTIPLSFPTGA